jgi:hypothetical protein
VLPAAILGTENLEVTQIDPTSVRLADVPSVRLSVKGVETPFEEELCDCHESGGGCGVE